MQLQPYLFFNGNCEEALAAYAGIFAGEASGINRYAGSPMQSHAPEGWEDKIMHASFNAPGVAFMAADSPRLASGAEGASRVSMSIGSADAAEGKRIFDALASGGTVTAPYEKQFWGASFGMVTDRFGIDWMVNAGG